MARPRILDVSELEPPEPMTRALAALRALAPDEYLLLRHRRVPVPLLPMLAELGFAHRVRPGRTTAVEVLAWRQGAPEPEADG